MGFKKKQIDKMIERQTEQFLIFTGRQMKMKDEKYSKIATEMGVTSFSMQQENVPLSSNKGINTGQVNLPT